MAHGALGYNVLTPWRMLLVTVQTCNSSLMHAAVAGYSCRSILVTLDAVGHIKRNQLRFCLPGKNSQHGSYNDCRAKKTKQKTLIFLHHFTTPFSCGNINLPYENLFLKKMNGVSLSDKVGLCQVLIILNFLLRQIHSPSRSPSLAD